LNKGSLAANLSSLIESPVNPYLISAIALGAILIILFLSTRRRPRAKAIANPQAAESARQSFGAFRQILAPTAGTEVAERGVELACRIGKNHGGKINLLYVLTVPRSLPLQTPLPEEEAKAKTALSRAESIVNAHGMESSTRVLRARTAGEGILQYVKETRPDVIVTAMRPAYAAEESLVGRTTDYLLREAPCEVIVAKSPSEPEEGPKSAV
jgi:nucleotide-binding universal stress UspA family protein